MSYEIKIEGSVDATTKILEQIRQFISGKFVLMTRDNKVSIVTNNIDMIMSVLKHLDKAQRVSLTILGE